MLTMPRIVEREAAPYVAIPATVTMREIGPTAQTLLPAVFAWLAGRGIAPAGPPFFRYVVIDMARALAIEFGVPTATEVAGDGRVLSGRLPGGRFVALVHRGPYDRLYDANAVLIGWAKERGIRFDSEATPAGDRFGCRLESYLTDPRREPDPERYETEVAIRIVDGGSQAPASARPAATTLAASDAMATIAVRDLATAHAFYHGRLGLPRLEPASEAAATYASGSTRIVVYPSRLAGSNQATAATWALGARFDVVLAALRAAGIAFEHYDLPGVRHDGDVHVFGAFKAAWFKDPDGNILHINSGGRDGGM
jgi:effector-binding domain-containing protein/catechol 2,3-dioxygenase-like lactoylglutathione lyase family enzyme